MADKQIVITISAKDLASKDFAEVRSRLEGIKHSAREMEQGVGGAGGGIKGLVGSLGPLGPAVAGAFSIGAITSFVSGLVDAADEVQKMADRVGDSTDRIQELQYISGQTSVSFDGLISAAQNLQLRLGDDDAGAVGAMRRLGLNIDEVKNAGAAEAIYLINGAMQSVTSETDRAAIMAEIFGKNWKDLAPAMRADMADIAAGAPKMSADTVAALDQMGDAWDTATRYAKAYASDGLAAVWAFSKNALGAAFWEDSARAQVANAASVDKNRKAVMDLTGTVKAFGPTAAEAERITKDLDARLQAKTKTVGSATAAVKKHDAALSDLVSTMQREIDATIAQANADHARDLDAVVFGMREGITAGNAYADAVDNWNDAIDRSREKLPQFIGLMPALTSGLDDVSAASSVWEDHKEGIGNVADAFGGLSRASEMAGHTTIASILSIAQTTAQAFAQGGPVAGGIALVTGLMTTFGDKLFKAEGRKVNDLRDEFIAAAGGLAALNAKAHDAGLTLDRVLKAKSVTEYEAAVKELNAAFETQTQKLEEIERLTAEYQASIDTMTADIAGMRQSLIPTWNDVSAAAEKYGLEVDGAGIKVQQLKTLSDTTEIVNDWEMLTRAGWDTSGMLIGMADELSATAQQAMKWGTELPAQMEPILQSLLDQGGLVDANGDKLKDLSGIKFGAPIVSDADKINLAIDKLVQSLADMIDKLNKLPGLADDAATGIEDAFDAGPPWDGWRAPDWPGDYDRPKADYPSFASGVRGFAGGMAIVGEDGPELVRLPAGSDVYSTSDTRAILRGGAGGGPESGMAQAIAAAVASAIGRVQLSVRADVRSYIDGREAARGMAPYIPAAAKAYGGIG